MNEKNIRLLTSKTAIQTYIANISGEPCSEYMFRKYVERGLPARYDDNRWIAHADNIDEFFIFYTKVSMRNALGEIDKMEGQLPPAKTCQEK